MQMDDWKVSLLGSLYFRWTIRTEGQGPEELLI